jgi:hypothetical protein
VVAGSWAAGQDTTGMPPTLPRVATHNNTVPTGVFQNGAFYLNLEIVKGEWYPEAEDGPHVAVYAFAEAGKAPSIPGPLIRVPESSQIKLRPSSARQVTWIQPAPGERRSSCARR